jgi:hypothetical protein
MNGQAPAVMEAIRNNLEARGVKLWEYDYHVLNGPSNAYYEYWTGLEVLAARMHAADFKFTTAPQRDGRIPKARSDLWATRIEYERLAGKKLRGNAWASTDRLKVKIQEMEAAKAAQASEEMLTGSDEGEQCELEDVTAIVDMRTANDVWQSNYDAWFTRTQAEQQQQRVAKIEAEQSAQAAGGWAQAVASWESFKVVADWIGACFIDTPVNPPKPDVAIERSAKRRRLERELDMDIMVQDTLSDDEHEASGIADASNAYIDATTASAAGHDDFPDYSTWQQANPGKSQYEYEREKNIAGNEQFLSSMGFTTHQQQAPDPNLDEQPPPPEASARVIDASQLYPGARVVVAWIDSEYAAVVEDTNDADDTATVSYPDDPDDPAEVIDLQTVRSTH